MLVIRLSRTGRKKQPYYRVVVAEKSAPVKGRLIEVLGHFNPRTKELKIDVDRAKERVKNGAQPSETAEALLEKAGVLKRDAITEKNRRPERKSKKAMKAEAEGGDAPKADAVPAAEGDAETDDSAKATDEGKAGDKAETKDEQPAEDKAEDKSDDKPKKEAKSEEKATAKADEPKKDDASVNDDKGDSQ